MQANAYLSVSRVAQRLQKIVHGLTFRQAQDRIYYQVYHASNPIVDPLVDVRKICGRLYMSSEAAERIIQGEMV